jgi:hypothetical protein
MAVTVRSDAGTFEGTSLAETASMRHCFLFLLLFALSGCGELRRQIVDARSETLLEEFRELDDCDRITFLETQLTSRRYDSYLETMWPTNGTILEMIDHVRGCTGIACDVFVSCWSGFSYGSDDMWLQLVEPWRLAVGCDGRQPDLRLALRACDRELSDVVDAFAAHPLTATAASRSKLHVDEFDLLSWGFFLDSAKADVQRGGGEWITDQWIWGAGNGRVSCWGVLPQPTEPELHAFVGRLARDRWLVKVMTRADVLAPVVVPDGELATLAEQRMFKGPGVLMLFESRSDGAHLLFTGTQPAR